jgi:phosphohistidine swiveling domain-containing protein
VTVAAAPDVLFRKFGDEAVLLHLGTERYFTLNDTALRIWELLTSGEGIPATAAVVAQEYDVDLDTVTADIEALLAELRSLRLIDVDPQQ